MEERRGMETGERIKKRKIGSSGKQGLAKVIAH